MSSAATTLEKLLQAYRTHPGKFIEKSGNIRAMILRGLQLSPHLLGSRAAVAGHFAKFSRVRDYRRNTENLEEQSPEDTEPTMIGVHGGLYVGR